MMRFSNVKIKYISLICFYIFLFAFGVTLVFADNNTDAKYESSKDVKVNVDKAIFLLKPTDMIFNLNTYEIVPSNNKYNYTFSIANYDDTKQSEVDMEYTIDIRTTTNLPLNISLYRNVSDINSATNILTKETVNDSNGVWYNLYKINQKYNLNYTDRITDTYTLSINFPTDYKTNKLYAGMMEAIEIRISANQVI